mmetsp:Transcript_13592/g.37540  ORF Transcript_13592/g.37540 Transcript_13592/m.37540 type:complete len:197 (+) Transcript_13592:711-1301(+)
MPGKLFPTRALLAVRPYPHCNTFELVSPPLQSGPGLGEVSSVPHELQYFTASGLLQVNRSMGFHVHIDVSHWSLPQLVKVCQQVRSRHGCHPRVGPAVRNRVAIFQSHTEAVRIGRDWSRWRQPDGVGRRHDEPGRRPPSSSLVQAQLANSRVGSPTDAGISTAFRHDRRSQSIVLGAVFVPPGCTHRRDGPLPVL